MYIGDQACELPSPITTCTNYMAPIDAAVQVSFAKRGVIVKDEQAPASVDKIVQGKFSLETLSGTFAISVVQNCCF